ncbi:MAG: hypothetical protein AUG51_12335 [Acidobacteria bacterium 13_1_20CM_3_53_8]|nr:MAG: hypothetical protein AUG51_12335 [Acidobacteria bacterium 13_1_20CM_3_53_8]
MKRIVTAAVLALLIGLGCLPSLNHLAAAQTERNVNGEFRTGSGKKLVMDLRTGGSIEITGQDSDMMTVSAFRGGRDGLEAQVEFNTDDAGLRVYSHYDPYRHNNFSANLKFTVKVPRKTDIEIDSMGGAVKITGIEGNIEGKTMGGDLNFSNLRGELHFTTMGGSVNVRDSEVNGKVSTMGGPVLIQNVTGSLKGSTMGGGVTYQNVNNSAGTSSADELRINSMGGDINVGEAPGGADVTTMGGNIFIRSAAKFVKAKTMGGNIQIDSLDGGVKATTMGGNVQITMVGDPNGGDRDVYITSLGGDITLTVPAGLSMEVGVELAYTQKRRRDYHITSDFPLQQNESANWDYTQGSPRKYIYATGSVGNGRYKVIIKTINGDVTIRRG